jgi:hypothetical protein
MTSEYVIPILLFLAGQTVAFLTVCIAVYTRVMSSLKELEIRVNMVEKNENEIFEKLEELLGSSHRIELQLTTKQDKT